MIANVKSFLKTIIYMTITGLITYIVYLGPSALIRAAIHDVSDRMTASRSFLYLLTVVALQLLYCVLLAAFRYNSWGEGIRKLTDDCKTEPYGGLWKDMKKLFAKERLVLFVGLILITLTTVQFFIPFGLPLTSFFIGITGVTMQIPDFLLTLFLFDPASPNMGLLMIAVLIGMFGSLVSFSGMYLCVVSLKRRKWYKEWKVG